MEKFSNWRDKGTGISPFMPAPAPKFGVTTIPLWLVKLVVFVLKTPILLLALVFSYVAPKPVAKFLLILFGFIDSDITVDGVKKSNTKQITANLPQKNDFILVNYSSPLDCLILSTISSNPVFIIPKQDGKFVQFTAWSFFFHTLASTFVASGKKTVELSTLKNKTVFVFAEGTSSNNKAVLPFLDISIPADFKRKAAIIKLPIEMTTPIPMEAAPYVLRILTSFQNRLRIKIVLVDGDATLDEYRGVFEKGKVNLVGKDMNIARKREFLSAYNKIYKIE